MTDERTPNSAPEDTLFVGGRIYPSASERTVEALLVRDGRIASIGGDAEVRAVALANPRVVRLNGTTLTPGFTDAHIHLTSWALARRRVSLADATDVNDAVERVGATSGQGTGWLRGHGWSRARLGRLPTRHDLDRLPGDRPVFLDSQDLHSAWLNGAALAACGIDRSSPDPPGGRMERDPTGEPTGILYETARAMAIRRIPPPTEYEIRTALIEAQSELHGLGITGIHSVEATGLRDLQLLAERGDLTLRVLQHIQHDTLDEAIALGLRSGFGGDRFRIGGVKIFLDGALGSRTAWLREPYEGDPGNRGIQTLASDDFRNAVRQAARGGLAATVHAIGDAAVELAIEVLGSIRPPTVLPHRIEHLQLCPPELWRRAGASGIVASMQPVHLLTDIPAADRSWGHARSRGAYAFGGVARHGMVLAFGSDAPVETPDPRPGLFAARRRRTWRAWEEPADTEGDWYPEHALSGAQAVAAYTEGPAIAAGLPNVSGSLRAGHAADLSVWSIDPVMAEPEDYRSMTCMLTMVGGEIVFRSGP
jgi:predicted amidohydrolase YtcJ